MGGRVTTRSVQMRKLRHAATLPGSPLVWRPAREGVFLRGPTWGPLVVGVTPTSQPPSQGDAPTSHLLTAPSPVHQTPPWGAPAGPGMVGGRKTWETPSCGDAQVNKGPQKQVNRTVAASQVVNARGPGSRGTPVADRLGLTAPSGEAPRGQGRSAGSCSARCPVAAERTLRGGRRCPRLCAEGQRSGHLGASHTLTLGFRAAPVPAVPSGEVSRAESSYAWCSGNMALG